MDVFNLVWHLLYPTALPNHQVQVSGGSQSYNVDRDMAGIFVWADIRSNNIQDSSDRGIWLRASNHNDFPILLRKIKEGKINGFTRKTHQCRYLPLMGNRVNIGWSCCSN